MRNLGSIFIIGLIISIIGLSSCSKSGQYDIIPESSTLVMVFDGKSLSDKVGFSSFADSKTYQYMKNEIGEGEMADFMLFDPIFKNTEESGINMKSEFFMFSYKKEEVSYFALVFNLLDKAKLETTINNIGKVDGSDLKIEAKGSLNYLAMPESDGPIVIWDDKKMMLLMSAGSEITTEAYLTEAQLLWQQKSDKSIINNKDFSKFADKKKDVSLWMDYSIFFDNLPPMQKMTMQSSMPFDMSGTLMHFHIDFQEGQAVLNYDVVMNDEMKSFMKDNKFIKDKFDLDILDVFPAKSYANFSVAIDFLSYFEVLKNTMEQNQQNMDAIDQQVKAQTGMTIKEALNEFSGEIVMNIHRIAVEEVDQIDYMAYYQSGGEGDPTDFMKKVVKPVIYYSFAAEMNNNKLFDVLIQTFGEAVAKTGDYYTLDAKITEGYFGLFGKKLVFTNDIKLIEDVVDGKVDGESLAKSLVGKNLKDFPTYAFVDLDLDNYPAELKESIMSLMGDDFETFNAMITSYKMIEIKPTSISSAEMIIHMKDKSKNSLELMLRSVDNNIEAIAE